MLRPAICAALIRVELEMGMGTAPIGVGGSLGIVIGVSIVSTSAAGQFIVQRVTPNWGRWLLRVIF
jgi:hypothetical protein